MTLRRIALALVAVVAVTAAMVGCVPEDARVADASPSHSASRTATSTPTPTPTPTASCAERIVAGMTPDEMAGQLILVGLDVRGDPARLDQTISQYHASGVVLLGGWHDGVSSVQSATAHLQTLAPATAGLGLLVAADQEGGEIQQLRGEGFSTIPSGTEQGGLDPADLQSRAAIWGGELAAAGVNLDLAPVADTVPAELGRGNPPIGGLNRQFSSDPVVVASHVAAVVRGMDAAGVGTALKHFPGLGRVTGNTDFTDAGTVDDVTVADDVYVRPFAVGVNAGAPVVMVSSAIYSQIDPGHEAVFSSAVMEGMLRDRLRFDGVVISDDIGAAASVASTPVTERATAFVGAGGNLALTADPAAVAPFHDSLVAAMSDPAFALRVAASATRVVQLKIDRGLATCG